MNPKVKKILIIAGLAFDVLITIILFVFSILILTKIPETKYDIDPTTFFGWFQIDPLRILLLDVLPLAVLLVLNVIIAIWYFRKTKEIVDKKSVSLNDLSEEEKAALKQKILQEMMQESKESK